MQPTYAPHPHTQNIMLSMLAYTMKSPSHFLTLKDMSIADDGQFRSMKYGLLKNRTCLNLLLLQPGPTVFSSLPIFPKHYSS